MILGKPENPYASPSALTETEPAPRIHSTFCGLRPMWTRPDRFYKFYITETAIYGAWLGGQFHDKLSVRYQLSPFYLTVIAAPIVELIARWADNRRSRLELHYDALFDSPDKIISNDLRNLVVPRDTIQSVTISAKTSYWTLWQNSGIILITGEHEEAIRILVRDVRDLVSIADDLRSASYPVIQVS